MGISEGDLLIVHSSADALKTLNCNGAEFIDLLIESVGASGTIALPAFPDESMLKTENGLKIYDPKRSVAWTGMLPNLLLRKKGAIRSSFPYNPLVAWGEKAEEMMTKNLETVYAHGNGSCWGFCAENHAKVLFLGVPTFHSNTILHVVEDYQPEFWPEDWYTEQEYLVKQSDGFIRIKTKVRDVKWSMYLSELFTERKYVKAGYIQKRDFEGLCFVNLVDFDMKYGHRNDIDGYALAMTDFDVQLKEFERGMKDDDILIITADHGCDPATPSTDHSREYVPMLIYGKHIKSGVDLKTRNTFADISATILELLDRNK
jgi:aminoglycoside N3'-acetyltransferase